MKYRKQTNAKSMETQYRVVHINELPLLLRVAKPLIFC